VKVRVAERFLSLQGEGLTTGVPTYFIRLSGCNLRCSWCDTPYAFEGGEEVEVASVVEEAFSSGAPRVCITGGEPLLQRGAVELLVKILERGVGVDLETNGTIPLLPVLERVERSSADPGHLLISMDVKCPSSGEEGKTHWENLKLLRESDQLKFVVADEEDILYAERVLKQHPTRAELLFTPVWGAPVKALAELFLRESLRERSPIAPGRARFLLQMHKYIWGEGRGEGIG